MINRFALKFFGVALVLGLKGCAATYQRDQTVLFVEEGEAALVASRAYYNHVVERNNGAIRLLYRFNPECPMADFVVLRKHVSRADIEKISDPACRAVFERSNSLGTLCLSDEARKCRNEVSTEGEYDLRSALGTNFEVRPLTTAEFKESLALAELMTEYLDILSKFAQRDESEKIFSERLSGLLTRINGFACTLEGIADDCTPANAPALLKASELKTLQSAGALLDLIVALRDDAKAARDIHKTLDEKGGKFDQQIVALLADLDRKRKTYLATGEMSRLEIVAAYWQNAAAGLTPEKREPLIEQWILSRSGLDQYLLSPVAPATMLKKLQKSHAELRGLFRGELTVKQRQEQAAVQAKQLGSFFRLASGFVRSIGSM